MTATGLPTCRAAGSVEGEHSLNGDVHGRDIEGFKHDLKGQCRIRLSGRNSSTFQSKERFGILLRAGNMPIYPTPSSYI